MNKHRILVFLVITSIVLMACGLFASPNSNSTGQDGGGTDQPLSPSAVPSLESPVSEEDVFPLTPDPINVTATLDTENAVTYDKNSYDRSAETEGADGTLYELRLQNDMLLMEDEEGDLAVDYDSDLTMTPVSSIEGLPFSQGYLAAVHLGPDGAKLVNSAILSMEIPGEYNPEELVGFAADGTGEDLHLYPASFYSYDGKTYAEFYITHFSLYGVAPILVGEIEAQQGHPPENPSSQDDQELAPIIPIETNEDDPAPLLSKKQLALNKSYDRLIKKKIENLDQTKCERVTTVVQEYNTWISKVEKAGLSESYKSQIQRDQNAMLYRLIDCIRPTCETCLNPQAGVKPDKKQVGSMTVMIEFARDLTSALHLGDDKNNNLWRVNYECSKNAGLPLPVAGIADGGPGSGGEKVSCP
jgi:hypothetical protein